MEDARQTLEQAKRELDALKQGERGLGDANSVMSPEQYYRAVADQIAVVAAAENNLLAQEQQERAAWIAQMKGEGGT